MIGAFARMLGSRDRVLSLEETGDNKYAVNTRNTEGVDQHAEAHDAPPEGFVHKIPHEGGDVFLAPVIEALRNVLRGGRAATKRADVDEATATLPRVTEKD